MTDKEQIMIDGINVSKCEYFKDGMCYAECDLEGYTDWECKDTDLSNCYFKQLARKTQECEELKEELATYKKMLDNPEFRIALTDFKTGEREVWRKLGRKADRYRKALEEIEKVCLEDTRTFADGTTVRYDSLDDILNIINKAKGDN